MKKELITFRRIGNYESNNLTQPMPSCFNGEVRYKKYKITIEEIEESNEVYCERLQALRDNNTNWHNYEPLQKEAEKLNYTFKQDRK